MTQLPASGRSAICSGPCNNATRGGDGFETVVDPEDPNILYAQSQYGGLVRFDRQSGEAVHIRPQPGKDEGGLKWNWDSPIIIAPTPTRDSTSPPTGSSVLKPTETDIRS